MSEIHLDLRLGIAMMMQLKAAWRLALLGKTDADFGTLLIMNLFCCMLSACSTYSVHIYMLVAFLHPLSNVE